MNTAAMPKVPSPCTNCPGMSTVYSAMTAFPVAPKLETPEARLLVDPIRCPVEWQLAPESPIQMSGRRNISVEEGPRLGNSTSNRAGCMTPNADKSDTSDVSSSPNRSEGANARVISSRVDKLIDSTNVIGRIERTADWSTYLALPAPRTDSVELARQNCGSSVELRQNPSWQLESQPLKPH